MLLLVNADPINKPYQMEWQMVCFMNTLSHLEQVLFIMKLLYSTAINVFSLSATV